MAWEKLGSTKITGDTLGTADYTEVFASDLPTGWAEDYETGYGGNFRGNYDGSSTANALWVDFNDGTIYNIRGWIDVKTSKSIDVSDTKWTLRYTLNINTFSTGGQILMGMSTNSSKYNESQRFLGVRIMNGDDIRLLATNNSADEPSGSNTTSSAGYNSISTGTDYFVEIYRNSSTLGLRIRTGSHGGILVHDVSQTIAGTGTKEHLAMDYIKFMNKNSGGSGEGIKAVFKDLEIYDGLCAVGSSNTITVDGGTNATATTETLDSTNGTTDWAEVGSRYTIDTSNNQIDFALVRDGSLYGTTTALYDLGASSMLNDTKFVLRYRLNFGTIDDPTRTPSVQFVFGAYSNTDGISISQDAITMFCAATSNTGNNLQFGVTDANGAYSQTPNVAFDASGTGVTGNNNWYVEMVRTSASAGVARLYSDSTYETLVQEKSLAFSSSNPQNLRYIGAKFFGSNTLATPTYNGYMSDVKIWDGVTDTRDGFTAKKHLMVDYKLINDGSGLNSYTQFNSDTGSNYAWRGSDNGGATDSTSGASGTDRINDVVSVDPASQVIYCNYSIINDSANEKLIEGSTVANNQNGTGNGPERREFVGKYANSSDAITKIKLTNSGGGDFFEDSEVTVYGTD